ncbi:TonB-dependent receptor domain-containing protein [Geobacter grbiciae]|uniref:TonB-dependent receptor domain-containing protein n=1 Tax=Geobacter grbiciae TaxID=155042 RepID=UPI002484B748|nr:TonB-dependent receptor [Geobacter grbiciae]
MRSFDIDTPFLETSPAPPHLVLPGILSNNMHGETYGVEVAADWSALEWWRLQAAYTLLEMRLGLDSSSGFQNSSNDYLKFVEGTSPQHQGSLRSSMNLGRNVELDLWVRYMDNLPYFEIDRYVTLDARLAWKPTRNLELSLVGRNLADNHHPEFKSVIISTAPTEVERSYYGKITWRY